MRNAAVDAVTVRVASGLSPRWRRRVHDKEEFGSSTIDTSRLPPAAEGVITHKGEMLGSVSLAVNANGVVAALLEMRHRLIADRKSVVYGKSVAVRLDLGGRGIIKKKKT